MSYYESAKANLTPEQEDYILDEQEVEWERQREHEQEEYQSAIDEWISDNKSELMNEFIVINHKEEFRTYCEQEYREFRAGNLYPIKR